MVNGFGVVKKRGGWEVYRVGESDAATRKGSLVQSRRRRKRDGGVFLPAGKRNSGWGRTIKVKRRG